MDLGQFMLMRHEMLLTITAVAILIAEVATSEKNKARIIPFALGLFGLVTLLGFIPGETGTLFGGSYQASALTSFMKNTLNLAVLIIFLQAESWLSKEENLDKISEYFILTISTLIGMNFMISSGDFLTFYVGLETATIPIAGLAAFDKYKSQSAEAGIKLILSSALSSGILLFGLSMLYGATGSIYFADIAAKVAPTGLIALGFIFFVSGMGFKISLVPFHFLDGRRLRRSPNQCDFIPFGSFKRCRSIYLHHRCVSLFLKPLSYELWKPMIYTLAVITMTIGQLVCHCVRTISNDFWPFHRLHKQVLFCWVFWVPANWE